MATASAIRFLYRIAACGYSEFLPFSGPAKPMNPIMRTRPIPILALLMPGSDGDSSTTIGNSPGALSERSRLQHGRDETELKSICRRCCKILLTLVCTACRILRGLRARLFPLHTFPLGCCTFAAGYCTCEDQPHFDLQLKQGSGNLCKCYGCLTRMLEHLIQSLLNVRTPIQCPILPYMPTPHGQPFLQLQLGFVNDLDQRCDKSG